MGIALQLEVVESLDYVVGYGYSGGLVGGR